MKNHLKNYGLLVKTETNITSDQNITDTNNIKTLKAEDVAHGALEDERFTLIPFVKADFLQRGGFSLGTMKFIKKECYFPYFLPHYPPPHPL